MGGDEARMGVDAQNCREETTWETEVKMGG
jgi:hypothetical protein